MGFHFTHIDTVHDDLTLELADASSVAVQTLGDGRYFVFAGGFLDDGLSVFAVAADGSLINLHNVTDAAALEAKLAAADIAFARVNTTAELAAHAHLRRLEIATAKGTVSYPAPAALRLGEAPRRYGAVPALGEHSAAIRAEFSPRAKLP